MGRPPGDQRTDEGSLRLAGRGRCLALPRIQGQRAHQLDAHALGRDPDLAHDARPVRSTKVNDIETLEQASGWLEVAEKGSVLGIKFFVWMVTLFGRSAAHAFLALVIFYYV